MRRFLFIVGLILAFAPSAQAATRLEVVQGIAAHQFRPWCGDAVVVRTGGLRDSSNSAESWEAECEIHLSPSWRYWSRSALCRDVTHEYGHLAGLPHSTDPSNIMYPGTEPFGPCQWFDGAEERLANIEEGLDDLRYERRYWPGSRARVRRLNARIQRLRRAHRRLLRRIGK